MKKNFLYPFLFMGLLMSTLKTSAQDYVIKFEKTGSNLAIEEVIVENLTQKTSITINGKDLLHLINRNTIDVNPDVESLKVFPNPMQGQAQISFYAQESGISKIIISDISGRKIIEKAENFSKGYQKFIISGIKKGVYFINIEGLNYNYKTKLISDNISQNNPTINYIGIENSNLSIDNNNLRNSTICMNYNIGDLLRYTAYFGNKKQSIKDIPTSSKTIFFSFNNNNKSWSCNDPFTKTHYAGDGISATTKTITYSTVFTNVANNGYKCWITQNLGADNQASSATDQSASVAGWYWQFNRLQGYDGITQSLNWVTSINQNSNWLLDPCDQLLGDGWRLPTQNEWKDADGYSYWNNYNNTYSSVLKLHAAGYLRNNDQSLQLRGVNGQYWSSTQYSNSWAEGLTFNGSLSQQDRNYKTYGFSIRCIGDMCDNITPPTTSNAGPDQTICQLTTTLAANNPTVGTGQWYINGTGGQVSNANSPNATFSGIAGQTYILSWTISNPPYPSSSDDVIITITSNAQNMTYSHIQGTNGAPESKTVTYGTIYSGIGGTGNKCWITQNLGATSQASSASDNTENAAGWYWQFNVSQGHVASTSTPANPWLPGYENSNWTISNDPCNLLLGNGWRLPTQSEWTNADQISGWSNQNDAFASVLKLHSAGYIQDADKLLHSRGSNADYWSSTQEDNIYAFSLVFNSVYSTVEHNYKQYGFTLRCLK